METLRIGSKGNFVIRWQAFLRGLDLYEGETHGSFDIVTAEATKAFQRTHRLTPDGIAGNATIGKAMTEGFLAVSDSGYYPVDKTGPSWPAQPSNMRPASHATRTALFGAFAWKSASVKGNPEAIRIEGNWVRDNITTVTVPQLKGIQYAGSGLVQINKKIVPQFLGYWEGIEKYGHLHLIKSWHGAFAPRTTRGSTTILSNHSTGTAMDINYPWNALGRRPALIGEEGSLREIVPLGVKLGWYWGGWAFVQPGQDPFSNPKRLDGCHFEVVEILTEEQVAAALA